MTHRTGMHFLFIILYIFSFFHWLIYQNLVTSLYRTILRTCLLLRCDDENERRTDRGDSSFSFFSEFLSIGPGFLFVSDAYKWLIPKMAVDVIITWLVVMLVLYGFIIIAEVLNLFAIPFVSRTSTEIPPVTEINSVLKYRNEPPSTLDMVSSHAETEAPSRNEVINRPSTHIYIVFIYDWVQCTNC